MGLLARQHGEGPALDRRAAGADQGADTGVAPTRGRSPARRALRVDVERIDRMARGHEQPVALDAAEADIGRAFGQRDETDRLTARVEDFHSVLLRVAHAPAAPQIALDVAAEAVRRTARLGGDE